MSQPQNAVNKAIRPEEASASDKNVAVALLLNMAKQRGVSYEPEKLEKFSPLHLQFFAPERPCNLREDPHDPRYHIAIYSQIYDLFTALRYAEQEILPKLTLKNLNKITPEQICLWIREYHKRVAATLLRVLGTESGQYSYTIAERWHAGADFYAAFSNAWVKGTRENVHSVFAQYQISDEIRDNFLDMLEYYIQDASIKVPASYIQSPSDDTKQSQFILGSLRYAIAYHRDSLSAKHRATVDALEKLCPLPEDVPGLMLNFAKELLKKMKACNPKDENAVCELVAWAYYTETEIHGFPNGNGRTATGFAVNCVLRAFGYPDILMRTPKQRDDPNSTYSVAIREIDRSREPLTAHIKAQLKMAQAKTLKVSARKMAMRRQMVVLALQYNYCVTNMASNNIYEPTTVAYLRTLFLQDVNVLHHYHATLFATRVRTPDRYVKRLKEIANLDLPNVLWKKNFTGRKTVWGEGLTDEQTIALHKRFDELSNQHNCSIGVISMSPEKGIVMFEKLQYLELKALSKACTTGIDEELEMERTMAQEAPLK